MSFYRCAVAAGSRFLGWSALGSIVLFSFGCDSRTEWRSGPYELYWIDNPKELQLGYRLDNGALIGRVSPIVDAVGENADWIVARRKDAGGVHSYYLIPKALDDQHKNSSDIVEGPLDLSEFRRLECSKGLPPLNGVGP